MPTMKFSFDFNSVDNHGDIYMPGSIKIKVHKPKPFWGSEISRLHNAIEKAIKIQGGLFLLRKIVREADKPTYLNFEMV